MTRRCFCGARTEGDSPGWLDEYWPTEGGTTIHVLICPTCRGLSTSLTHKRYNDDEPYLYGWSELP